MARTTNCLFCGKEVKKGLFSSEHQWMEFGTGDLYDCCEECYEKYGKDPKKDRKRFAMKLDTIQRTKKIKFSDAEVIQMYLTYRREREEQLAKIPVVGKATTVAFFTITEEGLFSVRESGKGLLNRDVDADDMEKTLCKAGKTDCHYFDKNDVTKIEYAFSGSGSYVGLFRKAYSFVIRLNDETVMTYKPCLTKTAVLTKFMLFGYKKEAERQLMIQLLAFTMAIGTDLTPVRVKKI